MMGLRSLPWLAVRAAGERKGRSALAAGGVMLGVALFTGALVTSDSSARAIDRFIQEASGHADVVAVPPGAAGSTVADPGAASLPDGTLEAVAALPQVEAATGLVGFGSALSDRAGRTTSPRLNDGPPAAVLGLDPDGYRLFALAAADGGLPTAGSDEVAVSRELADELDLRPGSLVDAATPTGPWTVRVVGVLEQRGVGRLPGLVLTSIESASRLAGVGARHTQVVVQLEPGVSAGPWAAGHEAAIGTGVRLQPASRGLEVYRDQLLMLTAALTASAAGVLGIGGFLVYLTLSLTVVERTRLYGTLQALGATRRQVRRLVVSEALVLAAIATPVGLAVGVAVAKVLSAAGQRLLEQGGAGAAVEVRPMALVAGAAMGVIVTVFSSLLPARRAARLDPVAAMRDDHVDDPRLSRVWMLGAAAVVGGLTVLAAGSTTAQLMPAVLVVLGGSVLLVPPLLRPLAAVLGRATARLSRGAGHVAVLHLAKERTRSAYTLALVMLVMAVALSMGSVWTSFARSFDRQLERMYGDDLGVIAATAVTPEFVDALRDHPAIADVAILGEGSAELVGPEGNELIQLRAIEPEDYFAVADLHIFEGDHGSLGDALRRGGAVALPAPAADRLGLAVGESVVLRTTSGDRSFAVAATVEFSNNPLVVFVGSGDGRDLFGIEGSRNLLVGLAPGWTATAAEEALQRDLGDRAPFATVTTAERKADTRAQIGGGINGFFVLIVLAGIVGTFGLANTLAVSVTQRSREIGILRAIGARRRQVQAMAVVESATLVAVAFVLAVPLGAALSGPLLRGVTAGIGDLSVEHLFPWELLPLLAGVGLVIGATAAAWPARRASALDVDAALRFE